MTAKKLRSSDRDRYGHAVSPGIYRLPAPLELQRRILARQLAASYSCVAKSITQAESICPRSPQLLRLRWTSFGCCFPDFSTVQQFILPL